MSSAYFDRFDICAAHAAVEAHYHVGGWLRERPSNQRRREATAVQLHRMHYRAAPTRLDHFDALTENGREIYLDLVERYDLETDSEQVLAYLATVRAAARFVGLA